MHEYENSAIGVEKVGFAETTEICRFSTGAWNRTVLQKKVNSDSDISGNFR